MGSAFAFKSSLSQKQNYSIATNRSSKGAWPYRRSAQLPPFSPFHCKPAPAFSNFRIPDCNLDRAKLLIHTAKASFRNLRFRRTYSRLDAVWFEHKCRFELILGCFRIPQSKANVAHQNPRRDLCWRKCQASLKRLPGLRRIATFLGGLHFLQGNRRIVRPKVMRLFQINHRSRIVPGLQIQLSQLLQCHR